MEINEQMGGCQPLNTDFGIHFRNNVVCCRGMSDKKEKKRTKKRHTSTEGMGVGAEVGSKDGSAGAGVSTSIPDSGLTSNPNIKHVRMGRAEFQSFLRRLARSSGSIAKLARRWEINPTFLQQVIRGEKKPSQKVLNALGAEMEEETTTIYIVPLQYDRGTD